VHALGVKCSLNAYEKAQRESSLNEVAVRANDDHDSRHISSANCRDRECECNAGRFNLSLSNTHSYTHGVDELIVRHRAPSFRGAALTQNTKHVIYLCAAAAAALPYMHLQSACVIQFTNCNARARINYGPQLHAHTKHTASALCADTIE
jgi:hypothetical protein